MRITQNWRDDSLNLTFSDRPVDAAPDVSIKKGNDGKAYLELEGQKMKPAEDICAVTFYDASIVYTIKIS